MSTSLEIWPNQSQSSEGLVHSVRQKLRHRQHSVGSRCVIIDLLSMLVSHQTVAVELL